MTLTRAAHPFRFVTRLNLIELTGLKARSLVELASVLKTAPSSITYHHTHHFLKQHQSMSPEPPNDFAYWVTAVLKEERLGEQLAAIDTIQFNSLRALRDRLVQVIERHIAKTKITQTAPADEEFHFMKSISFVLPTPFEAENLAQFIEAVQKVSVQSLYHHIFEARLRLEKGTNDFSSWLEKELGETALAGSIAHLDPYTQTLESLRTHILQLAMIRLSRLSQVELHVA